MRFIDRFFQIMWGLHFLVFGINKWYVFYPVKATNTFAQQVIDSFYNSGYLMQAVGFFQILTGALLLFNLYRKSVYLVAFPICLNIVLYTCMTQNFSTPAIGTALFVFGANCYFLYQERDAYLPLLKNANN